MCLPGIIIESYKQIRLTLETVPPDHTSISKTHIAIRFNLRHCRPSVPSFAFGVLFKYSFTVLRGYLFKRLFHSKLYASNSTALHFILNSHNCQRFIPTCTYGLEIMECVETYSSTEMSMPIWTS